jgi:hypothetical protein
MITYKLIKDRDGNECGVVRSDGWSISFTPANIDYQEYLKWVDGYEKQFNRETLVSEWVKTSEGNTPEPADE